MLEDERDESQARGRRAGKQRGVVSRGERECGGKHHPKQREGDPQPEQISHHRVALGASQHRILAYADVPHAGVGDQRHHSHQRHDGRVLAKPPDPKVAGEDSCHDHREREHADDAGEPQRAAADQQPARGAGVE